MPRSGWVAAGAVVAALAGALAGTAPHDFPPFTFTSIAAALVCFGGAGLLAIRLHRRDTVRTTAFLVGVLLIGFRLLTVADPTPATAAFSEGTGPWVGRVVSIGAPRDGSQVATLELMDASRAGPAASAADATVKVAATLPRYPIVQPELEIRVGGGLAPVPDDDYGRYLTRIGVLATLRARTLEVVDAPQATAGLIEDIRRTGDEALTRALPEPEAGLASGILIGLRDRVGRDLAAAFTTAGVSHVVAISGWNIAIVGATIGALVRRWPRRRRALVVLAAIVIYAVLTGASSSVLRAAVMAAVVLLARETGRAGHAATALGWAVAGLLALDPGFVLDPGFALSAAATGGLIAWATPVTATLDRRTGGRLPGWLTESLGVSIAAEVATLPIALGWFGRFAVIAPLVNLFVVPLVAPAMATGGLGLIGGAAGLAGAPAGLAVIVGLPAWAALAAMVAIVRAAASLPIAYITLEPPANVVAAVLAAGVVIAVSQRRRLARRRGPHHWWPPERKGGTTDRSQQPGWDQARQPAAAPAMAARPLNRDRPRRGPSLSRRERISGVLLAAAIAGVVVVAANRPDGNVRIHVLDVGQGDAILVEGDRGTRMLVDGGPDPDRLLVQLDGRIPPWDRRIDLLVLSHPHEDHVGGLPLLLARYRVNRIVEPGMRGPGPGYKAWQMELADLGIATGRLATGDRFALDSIGLRVLWPDRESVPREPPDTGTAINNVSIVLLGTFGGERFLLAGDIEQGIDPVLLARGLPRVEVLKVAHHGSRTSSTDAFLEALRPRIGVVSVGARNPYGHPAPATIARLRDHGISVYRTDLNGTVDVRLDGHAAIASTEAGTVIAAARQTGRPAIASAPQVSGGWPARASAAFRCGIIEAGPAVLIGQKEQRAAPDDTPRRAPDGTPIARTTPRLGIRSPVGPPSAGPALLYHRPDDGSRQGRGLPVAPLPRSPSLGASARAGRRRGRRVARGTDRPQRNPGRPPTRGIGGASPRRRQDPSAGRAGTRAPPR
jgi:competence protein ComEC